MLTGLPGSSRSHMQLWAPAAPTIPAGPQTSSWLLFFPVHPHLQCLADQKPARAEAPFAVDLDLAGLGHVSGVTGNLLFHGTLLYNVKENWISSCVQTSLRACCTELQSLAASLRVTACSVSTFLHRRGSS